MDQTTTSYTQNSPTWLWEVFTDGPADLCSRYDQAITALIAAHVLRECPDRLDEREREAARELADLIPGVEPVLPPDQPDETESRDATGGVDTAETGFDGGAQR